MSRDIRCIRSTQRFLGIILQEFKALMQNMHETIIYGQVIYRTNVFERQSVDQFKLYELAERIGEKHFGDFEEFWNIFYTSSRNI